MAAWAGAGPMRWEYKVIHFFEGKTVGEGFQMKPEDFEAMLAPLGQAGWELVGLFPSIGFFKRPAVLP